MKKAEKAEKLKLMSEARNLEDNLIDDLFDQVCQLFDTRGEIVVLVKILD